MRTRARLPAASSVLPYAWSVLLALVLLGPALGRGFVLSYDMVWVPDLALTRDALGVGSGLPRAVPSDAVVAVLDQLVPGVLLQKVVLLGVLVGAGTGVLRLVPDLPVAARLVAVTAVQWNPFVAERLVMGHWPVLVTYAVLPWIVVVARSGSGRRPVPGPLWLLVPLASLSASGGLAAAVLVLATCRPRRPRGWASVLGLLAAANAPWLVSGLLHAGAATTDAAGGAAFALAGEGALPGPLRRPRAGRHLERRGRAGVDGRARRLGVRAAARGAGGARRPPLVVARPAARGRRAGGGLARGLGARGPDLGGARCAGVGRGARPGRRPAARRLPAAGALPAAPGAAGGARRRRAGPSCLGPVLDAGRPCA